MCSVMIKPALHMRIICAIMQADQRLLFICRIFLVSKSEIKFLQKFEKVLLFIYLIIDFANDY